MAEELKAGSAPVPQPPPAVESQPAAPADSSAAPGVTSEVPAIVGAASSAGVQILPYDPDAGEDDDDDDDEGGAGGEPPRKKRGGHGRRKIEIEYIDDKIRRHITFSKRKAGISKKAYELSRLTGAQVCGDVEHAGRDCSITSSLARLARLARMAVQDLASRLAGPHTQSSVLPSHANLRPSRVLVLSDSLLLCTFGAQVLLLISSERGQIYSFATPKLQPILVNDSSKQLIEQCLNAPDPAALVEQQQQQQQQQAPSMPPSMPAPQHYMAQPGMSQPGMPQHAGYVVAPGQMPMQDPHAAAAMAHAQAAAQAQAAAHAQAAGVHPGDT